jgi:hypothetical protein
MERRMKENSIKGLIYALLFIMMTVKSLFEKPQIKTTEGSQKIDTLYAPVPARWTR